MKGRKARSIWSLCLAIFVNSFTGRLLRADDQLPPAATESIDFKRDIQPIFARNCHGCHGPQKQKGDLRLDVKSVALKGGSLGPAILPGESAKSRLIQFVAGIPEEMRMPQKGETLSAKEIGLLRRWIDQGANWPDGLDPAGHAEREQHWAFQNPIRRTAPQAENSGWPRNEVDHFILARLAKEGLTPSPEADRRTLIRRLSFDLIGLPPTPEEVRKFLSDASNDPYAALVERLLSSPRYGERWARHWLDVVRFAESSGFETNLERKNAWPYRDYVIRAFNENKPYNDFVFEQLAGDTVGIEAATAFIVAGPWDAVKSPDIGLTLQQRMDELHDMVSTTGSAFLGLTVGCARCHNHKFDPISQKDYYAMQAVFAGVRHGDRPLPPPDAAERLTQADHLLVRVKGLEDRLAQYQPLANPAFHPEDRISEPGRNVETFEPRLAKFVRFTIHETAGGDEPCLDELEIFSANPSTQNVALASAGTKATASGTFPNSDLHKLEHINDGKVGNSHSWISNERGRGWVQLEFPEPVPINKIIWGRDREGAFKDRLAVSYTIEAGIDSGALEEVAGASILRPAVQARLNIEKFTAVDAKAVRFTALETTGLEPCIDELEVFTAEKTPRNIALAEYGTRASASGTYPESDIHRLEHINDGKVGNGRSWISNQSGEGWIQLDFAEKVSINKIQWGRDREGKFSDRLATNYKIEAADASGEWKAVAGSNDRRKYSADAKAPSSPVPAGLTKPEREAFDSIFREKAELESEIKKLTSFPAVYAGKFEKPEPTFLLYRGDPMQKRNPVEPGAIESIKPASVAFANLPEPERRVTLARWIIDPRNPLTARVMVNRMWQYHFGRGIVDTPSDFGLNGARPTHPELLDWLACEFVDQGWDIKAIHRLIVLSSTYRQASQPDARGMTVDADTRLLWRYPQRRLEAEPIRDSILAVSGNLNPTMGGPGFDLFEPNGNYVKVYTPRKDFGPTEWRRMVYQAKPRMRLDDTFGAFDCPDAGQIAPKRTSSTTPLQALNLLNSPFILQQAAILAKRLEADQGIKPEEQVRGAFELLFNRAPTESESKAALGLIRQHGLTPFCRAMLNANEFIYF